MDTKDLIVRYGAIFRKRFTNKEKLRFLSGISQDFSAAGYNSSAMSAKRGTTKAYNLYVGDIQKAKTIIMANYDTPIKSLGLFPYTPLSTKNAKGNHLIAALIPFLIVCLVSVLFITRVLSPVWSDGIFNAQDGLVFIIVFLLAVILVRYANGIPNKNNIVRNTSGVIACLEIAQTIRNKESVAFVLTDFGCLNRFGEIMLESTHKEKINSKKIIILDSIGGDGDVFVGYNDVRDYYGGNEKITSIDCSQDSYAYTAAYKISLKYTTGYLERHQVIRDKVNSRKDIEINEANYQIVLIDALKQIDVIR